MSRRVLLLRGAPRRRLLAACLTALVLLAAVPVASAALPQARAESLSPAGPPCLNCTPWRTINTDNGTVDDLGNAQVYAPSPACTNANLADYLEIKQAWIVNDGRAFYFRIQLCVAPTTQQRNNLRMGAGLDCNHDGDVADPWGNQTNPNSGDRKFVYQAASDQVLVLDGQNTTVLNLPSGGAIYGEELSGSTVYEWQAPLERVYPGCRGSVSVIGLGVGTVALPSPAPKDQTPSYDWSHPIDYGDAVNPDPTQGTCSQYPSRVGCDGARHGLYVPPGLSEPLRLGSLVDADDGTNQDAAAVADDTTGTADEDGVGPTPGVAWTPGGQGSIDATVTGGTGYLSCWVDWNNNTSWSDAGDNVMSDRPVALGLNRLTFSVPAGLTYPTSFIARCRLSPGANQAATVTGTAEFGEVEDHSWSFDGAGRPILPDAPSAVTDLAIAASGTSDVKLSWSNPPPNNGARVLAHASNPYFTSATGGFALDTTVSAAPWEYVHAGVRGTPPDAFYYIVYGRLGSADAAAPSNRVGLFEFGLVAGQP